VILTAQRFFILRGAINAERTYCPAKNSLPFYLPAITSFSLVAQTSRRHTSALLIVYSDSRLCGRKATSFANTVGMGIAPHTL